MERGRTRQLHFGGNCLSDGGCTFAHSRHLFCAAGRCSSKKVEKSVCALFHGRALTRRRTAGAITAAVAAEDAGKLGVRRDRRRLWGAYYAIGPRLTALIAREWPIARCVHWGSGTRTDDPICGAAAKL